MNNNFDFVVVTVRNGAVNVISGEDNLTKILAALKVGVKTVNRVFDSCECRIDKKVVFYANNRKDIEKCLNAVKNDIYHGVSVGAFSFINHELSPMGQRVESVIDEILKKERKETSK